MTVFKIAILVCVATLLGCVGRDCELNCQNGGTCVSGAERCDCDTGYEGYYCEAQQRTKFFGTYACIDVITSSLGSDTIEYVMTVTPSTASHKVLRLAGFFGSDTLEATITATDKFVVDQPGGNSAFGQISGSGVISGGTVTATLQLTANDATINGVWVKQQ